MKANAGVWIDHQRAVIVRLHDPAGTIETVEAKDPLPAVAAAVPRSYTHNDFIPEDRLERKQDARYQRFYDDVIDALRRVDTLLILGPGEAKGEFRKRLDHEKVQVTVAEVQTQDKMTERQLAAHVREYFESGE